MEVLEKIKTKLELEFKQSSNEAILVLINKRKLLQRYTIQEVEKMIEMTIEKYNMKLLNEMENQDSPKLFKYRSDKIQMLDIKPIERETINQEFKVKKLPIIVLYKNKKLIAILPNMSI